MGRSADCAAPIGVFCRTGIAYGDGPNQTLDAYWSSTGAGGPAVVMIHGGGWSAGSSSDMYWESVYLVRNGFTVFSINYTLSSTGHPSWPQAMTDVETAARWVQAHASTYGGDGSRLGAFGSSAGAHLAALLDTMGPEDGIDLATAVSWSGPMDMPLTYQFGDGYVRQAIHDFIGCTPGSCPNGEDIASSPDAHVTADDGSLLFFNAKVELVPIQQAHAMNRALRQAHVRHDLVVFDDTNGHASQLECHAAHVLGYTGTAIDGAVHWLARFLMGHKLAPTGDYCS
jgi:acetyl esterase/lipase